jgi:protoporphyrinogen/coproporphyrinogen III oxidase
MQNGNDRNRKQIVIIGGGITGLSAAYYAAQACRAADRRVQVTLIEKDSRLGGKIQTQREEGLVMELGPDSFLSRKTPALDLSRELGLEKDWVPTNPEAKKTYIVHRSRLHRIPPGLVLGIPTEWKPFLNTGLISPQGKIRAALDIVLPRKKGTADESLGHFLERRLGKEIVAHIAEPLLSGIYAGDAYKLSLQATFPQFKEVERSKRSLILGMLASRKQTQSSGHLPSIAKKSMFLSFRGGLGMLVEALRDELLAAEGVDVLTSSEVSRIARRREAASGHGPAYDVHVRSSQPSPSSAVGSDSVGTGSVGSDSSEQAGTEPGGAEPGAIGSAATEIIETPYGNGLHNGLLQADSVLVTTPLYTLADLLADYHTQLPSLAEVSRIPYVSVANVLLIYDKNELPANLDLNGSGFVVPKKEGRNITACTWTSSKWQHVAPADKVLLRAYVGRGGQEDIVHLPDDQILSKVLADLKDLMGLDRPPTDYIVNRWYRSMPQYPVGHRERIQSFYNELAAHLPGIFTGGAGFEGVGIPDCIAQGKKAAQQAVTHIKKFNH